MTKREHVNYRFFRKELGYTARSFPLEQYEHGSTHLSCPACGFDYSKKEESGRSIITLIRNDIYPRDYNTKYDKDNPPETHLFVLCEDCCKKIGLTKEKLDSASLVAQKIRKDKQSLSEEDYANELKTIWEETTVR